jgi:hypothetical protein
MRGQDIISQDQRIAAEQYGNARHEARLALGLLGETGQRVTGMVPGIVGRIGTLVRWEDEEPIVRWDDTGAEGLVSAEYLQRMSL